MIIDPTTHNNYDNFAKLIEFAVSQISDKSVISDYLYNVTDYDDSEDLTDIHPRDRNNVNLYATLLYSIYTDVETVEERVKENFKELITRISKMEDIVKAAIILVSPKSIVPLHVDSTDKPLYSEVPYYNVFTGLVVPSTDVNDVGVKVDKELISHHPGKPIIFNAQYPHEAWNHTESDWISLLLYIKKESFR